VQLIDWRIAELTGTRLVPAGPRLGLVEAVATVEDLRGHAQHADRHVAEVTGLDPAGDSAATVIVDRQEWVRANVESFRILTDPVIAALLEKRAADGGPANGLGPFVETIGSRAAGAEVGALLSYLATRVLGQFELIGPARVEGDDNAGGRLTLVAPNIVAAERALEVDPGDFRLWVCLHEVTHRTQFAAAPWLHGHVQQLLTEYLVASDLDAGTLLRRLRQAASGLRGGWEGTPASLVELVQTPEQSAILDRITGLMSLLEGHADVVMDTVGPAVIPSVATIRERFDKRRRDAKPLGRIVRRLLGVELKLRQYAEGAAFVRAVIDKVGMGGLNVVWSDPQRLPTAAEIREPERWLARTGVPPAIHA
jgi:coenzyme F420 biosynthesis associated uncharacterized protein